MNNKYILPQFDEEAFNCPNCGAYAHQAWSPLLFGPEKLISYMLSMCWKCHDIGIWMNEKLIYPSKTFQTEPNADLSLEIKTDYFEAAKIYKDSPRGAAALLRLCIQKIIIELGEGEKDLNLSIGKLVKNGLPVTVQQALDTVRVSGNEAIHPGTFDSRDNDKTVTKLFWLVNYIAEKMISEPKEIRKVFNEKVPDTIKQAINKRDIGKK